MIAGFDATLAEGRGRLTTRTGLEVATADGEGKVVAATEVADAVPGVWIAGCAANMAARGRNSGAAARGTKAGADADSCGLCNTEPRGGATGGRVLAAPVEGGPCWTAGWPSMVRAENVTFELRSWSTVKSVSSRTTAHRHGLLRRRTYNRLVGRGHRDWCDHFPEERHLRLELRLEPAGGWDLRRWSL